MISLTDKAIALLDAVWQENKSYYLAFPVVSVCTAIHVAQRPKNQGRGNCDDSTQFWREVSEYAVVPRLKFVH